MKNFLKKWGRTILIGMGILALALGLRLASLTYVPVFVDEAIYIRWSQVMRAEPTLRFVPLSDGKQPLFMWLTIPLLKIFANPLVAGRLTSVFAGLGILLGVFLVSYSLFKSKKIGLIAALIYAISPFSVFFDKMALVDSLLSLFGVWTFLGAIWVAKTLRLDLAMLTGFALGGGLLTKSPALFFVLLSPLTWIFSRWPKERTRRPIHLIKLVLLFGVSLAIGYGMYNILRLGPNFNMITLRNGDYVHPLTHFLTSPLNPLKTFLTMSFEWIVALGPGALLLLAAFAIILNSRKYWKETLTLLLWFLGPIVVQAEFAKNFTARYILFSIPFLFILAAAAFLAKKDVVKKLVTILFIVFVFQAAKQDFFFIRDIERANLPRSERSGYLEEWTAGTGIKEVADFLVVENQNHSDKTMVIGTEGFFGTLPDGLQIYLNSYPNIIVKGVGLPIVEVDKSLLESKKAGNKTYLVVNSTRFWGKAEELGLELVAVYPKAVRPDGSREALLFYEVTQKALNSKTSL